ncbi:hypothetical protein [Streptomyces sp. NK15101]|uniref:hypothetical protein n=1 Tax=Streptomyces sp. NK15101 TaxID=2873261 RepID=UPI001CED7DBF|nr:hypothetical protein [Streptomyces sp. NK15101]
MRLALSAPGPQITRLLEINGAAPLFHVYPTLTAAVRTTHPSPGDSGPAITP